MKKTEMIAEKREDRGRKKRRGGRRRDGEDIEESRDKYFSHRHKCSGQEETEEERGGEDREDLA